MPIYLDYAATTPCDPLAAAAMARCLTEEGLFANPASTHLLGRAARDAVEAARQQVADLIQADPQEIIWTSGATEANNLALKGAAQLYKAKGRHIITLKTEHPAVLDACQQLEKEGFLVTYLYPEASGLLNLDKLRDAIRPDTILISVMHVNNEIGVIQDIQAIANLTSAKGIVFHVDAAQSAGKIPLSVKDVPIDLLSLSAHKMYGPKGMGALYVRRKPRIRVAAQMHGGGHEQGMRSGTLATHQIVGMGVASELAKTRMAIDHAAMVNLRKCFLEGLSHLNSIVLHGDTLHAVPHIVNFRIQEMTAEKFIQNVPELAISKGSACLSKGIEPSYVLRAIGLTQEEAQCGVRFSWGRFTTQAEIEEAVTQIQKIA
jgi:cysteine desulfurase